MTLVGAKGEVVLQLELHPLRSLVHATLQASSVIESILQAAPTLPSPLFLEEQEAPDPRGLHHSLTAETAAGQPGGRGRRTACSSSTSSSSSSSSSSSFSSSQRRIGSVIDDEGERQ